MGKIWENADTMHTFFGIIYEKVDKEEQASQQKFEQNFSLL